MTDSILIRREGESDFRYEVRLCVAKLDKELDLSWEEIRDHLKLDCSADHLRKISYGYRKMVDNEILESEPIERVKSNDDATIPDYKEEIEILGDGSQKSDKLIKMSLEQSKDSNFLLKAHGYDSNKWEIISAKSSIWNQHNRVDGTLTLFSSKITVKPKINTFDFDRLLKVIANTKPYEPIEFKGKLNEEKTYLEVPLFDLHFGNSTLEYYKETLQRIGSLLENTYNEVLFIIGQDLFHNDNFKGTTANGTVIDKVDMEQAWEDAHIFYNTLINKALENSQKLTVIYSKGNHDESMAWAFVKHLEAQYKNNKDKSKIFFDTKFKERKAHMLGLNFIGTTHGDKNRNSVASNFSVEFPELWSKATTREVHMGHLHRKRVTKKPIEIVNDTDGVIVRELGTGNLIDGYHDDNGYTLAHKEFEIFEYTQTKKKRIHYV